MVTVVDEPTRIGPGVIAIPHRDSGEDFLSLCSEYPEDATVVCHQTFNGGQYDNGFYAKDGIDPNLVPQPMILSGHIHAPQSFGKVWYVGAPRWRTASDANVERAIWVVEHDDLGNIVSKTPVRTGETCRRIWELRGRRATTPVRIRILSDLDGHKDDIRVTCRGSEEWIRVRKPLLDERASGYAPSAPTRSAPRGCVRARGSPRPSGSSWTPSSRSGAPPRKSCTSWSRSAFMASSPQAVRRRAVACRARGVCVDHPDTPVVKGRAKCQVCYDRARARYYSNKTRGMCTAHPNTPVMDGRPACQKCIDYDKARYTDLIAQGMCTSHPDRPAESGSGRCQECRVRQYVNLLKRKYNITLEQYDAMLIAQCGRCAICKDLMMGRNEPCVDHSHKTGRVRELLCGPCNKAFGLLQENLRTIKSMADYSERHHEP